MRKIGAIVGAIVCLCGVSSAQSERIIGLLDLPDVTGAYADDACLMKAKAQVHGAPSAASRAIGVITMRLHPEHGCTLLFTPAGSSREEKLPIEESGYETPAAVVYERRGQWFRIRIPKGSAWIQRGSATDCLPYPQLLTNKSSYFRSDWNGDMRIAPGAEVAVSLPAAWKKLIPAQIGIEVLGVRRVGNEDWIHVQFAIEPCGDESTRGLKPVDGWVRAYRADGTTTAWFYSRGC